MAVEHRKIEIFYSRAKRGFSEIAFFDVGMEVRPPGKNRILKQTVQFWTYLRKKAKQVKGAKFAPLCPP